ncbi:MAG: N-acetyl-gamma-glutamyl-phosphate reductase [Gammaproteobacteria bacterium]|nr:N-acetyl-gamma-glutamyl-phosphate reductase [Gammaproteobacteria bacterium]
MSGKLKLGLVGARGYVGRELLRLVAGHPALQLAYASSRQFAGEDIAQQVPGVDRGLRYEALDAAAVAGRDADIIVLALPEGLAARYAGEIGQDRIIVDLSGDHRFDSNWQYGLPEHNRDELAGSRRISNPGCYATAMQLALAPLLEHLDQPPHCFGVSGYSGAGTTPSQKNDPAVLAANLLPYKPIGHLHEREVSHRLGREVRFMPHVAEFFRGISMTVAATLNRPLTANDVAACYDGAYLNEPLVQVSTDTPLVAAAAGKHRACVGGWQLSDDGTRLVVYATLDNLLKGAATQALQNINLACGQPELEGLRDELAMEQ